MGLKMNNTVIWVDDDDQVIGCGEKMETHESGQLHRAFSVYIINKNNRKVLLQRRAKKKYHSGGLWSNSCCSHPRYGSNLRSDVLMRLHEELGFSEELLHAEAQENSFIEIGIFHYFHSFGTLAENEIDHVFILIGNFTNKDLNPDREEIMDTSWKTFDEIDKWLNERPEVFTAWFGESYAMVRNWISSTALDGK